jgi:hypothetical protein
MLDDAGIRRQCAERGLARAAHLRWSDAAEKTAAVLRDSVAARPAA